MLGAALQPGRAAGRAGAVEMLFKFILNIVGVIILLALVSYFVSPTIVAALVDHITGGLQEIAQLVSRLSTDGTAARLVQQISTFFSRI